MSQQNNKTEGQRAKRCETCLAWWPLRDDPKRRGFCHSFPPQWVGNSQFRFPICSYDDVCLEWTQKYKPAAKAEDKGQVADWITGNDPEHNDLARPGSPAKNSSLKNFIDEVEQNANRKIILKNPPLPK